MLCLLARWVVPVDLPPIAWGEVEVRGSEISYCGPQRGAADRPAGCATLDLGDAIVLPGFVNVHTHLEYTLLRGFLEDVAFFPWVRSLTAIKSRFERQDWRTSAMLGAAECIASGITTIGDNTDSGVVAEVAAECGLRGRIYQEIFGIDHRQPVDPLMADLDAKLAALSDYAGDRIEIGVSPHAPYTVRPALFRALESYCSSNRLRTSIHVAESPAESELTERGTGPFAQMLSRRGIVWTAPMVSPTRYLADQGMLGPHALLVHCVHQNEADIALTAASGASIAHCPKSNAKLGAGLAPLTLWLHDPALAVGLGTDSAVSNNTLDLIEEMRFGLLGQRARLEEVVLTARQMVEAATLGGARALGWGDRIGTLTAGKRADITAVRLDTPHASPATDPYAALVYCARADDICLTMADGRILYQDGRFTNIDTRAARAECNRLRERIAEGGSEAS